jgi:uncharacterized OsmC-like protein
VNFLVREQKMAEQTINGVPAGAVSGLVTKVRENRAKGQTRWKAVTTWRGGFNCESHIRNHSIYMDEAKGLGGTDTAPNMVETVLAAYGSCLTAGYVMNATLRGIEIKDLQVEVEGDLDLAGFLGLAEEVPAGFSEVRALVHLEAEASPQEIQMLHDHVLRTSPVGCMLTQPLKVSTELG